MSGSERVSGSRGLSLEPFRGLRPRVDDERLGRLLCPPYDVIDGATRARLLATDPENAVAIVLPDPTPEGYQQAARELQHRVDDGLYAVDAEPALYVYEMQDPHARAEGGVTRGLLGAVELRDAADGVILPHENTMAGPVADRLEVMTATEADLEPIYLVYDGGGPASDLLRSVDGQQPLATATTPDGVRHRLWAVSDPEAIETVRADLTTRRALIADGHHRYATYQERQRRRHAAEGPGPWDRGLALVVDSSEYGPQVHAIHRVIRARSLDDAVAALEGRAQVSELPAETPDALAAGLPAGEHFAGVLTDGRRAFLVQDVEGRLVEAAERAQDDPALARLDVTIVHRALVERIWSLPDDVDTVGYAHTASEAVAAVEGGGFAVLLRPTPVSAVAAVAAAGARMPRKSTLFTPKPASGLVLRRLRDQTS